MIDLHRPLDPQRDSQRPDPRRTPQHGCGDTRKVDAAYGFVIAIDNDDAVAARFEQNSSDIGYLCVTANEPWFRADDVAEFGGARRPERDCTHHVMFGELGQWAGIDYQRARTCGRKDSGRVLESDIWRHSVDVNYVEISNQNVGKFHTEIVLWHETRR